VGEVRADDAQAEELDASDEEHHDEHGGDSRRRTGREGELEERLQHDGRERRGDHDEREHHDEVERRVRERDDRPARPAQVLQQRVRATAEHPLGAPERNAGLSKAHPRPQSAEEAVRLRQPVQSIHGAAVHEAEVPSVDRHVHVGDPLEQPIEDLRRPTLKAATLPVGTLCVDDLVALPPGLD